MSDSKNKTMDFKKFGVFASICFLLFVIVISFSFLAKKFWDEGLKKQTVDCLTEYCADQNYTVQEYISAASGLSTSSAIYKLNRQNSYAVIIRVMTMYGPLPAVFVCENGSARFITYLHIDSFSKKEIISSSENSQIVYWENRIPQIVEQSLKNAKASKKEGK